MRPPAGTPILLAIAVGLLIGLLDIQMTGDDSTKVTLLMLVVGGAAGGALQPVKPWRMALAIGPGPAIVHLTARVLGVADHVDPDPFVSRLMLLPVGIVASSIGAYLGAFARGAVAPASAD